MQRSLYGTIVPILTEFLGLPDVEVESYETNEDGLTLSVESLQQVSNLTPLRHSEPPPASESWPSGARPAHQPLPQDVAAGKSSPV